MKILTKTYNPCILTLIPQTNDDIYTLYNIIDINDIIESKTSRKIEIRTGVSSRIVLNLTIKVETLNVDLKAGMLFLKGKTMFHHEHVNTGSYHTLEICMNQRLRIKKEYFSILTEESLKKKQEDIILFIIIKQKEVLCIKKSEYDLRTEMRFDVKNKSYKNIVGKLTADFLKAYKLIVLASVCSSNTQAFRRELMTDQQIKCKIESKTLEVLIESDSINVEKIISNNLLKHANKFAAIEFCADLKELLVFFRMQNESDLAIVGLNEVNECLECGALKSIFVTNKRIKSYDVDERKLLEKLCERLKKMHIKIHIIPIENELGEKLEDMGGIGGIIKYNYRE